MTSAAASTLFSVAGKNVVVTGGSRGIGYMIAKGFYRAGANVLLTSRSDDACRDAVKSIVEETRKESSAADAADSAGSTAGPTCRYVSSNVSNRKGCEDLALHIGEIFDGKLHVLVNNAGTSWGEPLDRNSSERSNWGFDKVFDLNVKGMFYLTRSCIPYLENAAVVSGGGDCAATDPSRVINIGSVAGIIPQDVPTHAYDASKAAVHSLTKKFAYDLSSKNITVNAVAPGYVPSRMSAGLSTWGGDGDDIETMAKKSVPLRRPGNEDDMAGACIYLSSRAGSWCTGVILNVDGGTVGARPIPVANL